MDAWVIEYWDSTMRDRWRPLPANLSPMKKFTYTDLEEAMATVKTCALDDGVRNMFPNEWRIRHLETHAVIMADIL